jgi:glycosyltransferase involved in cell wall biosynthesis
VIALLHGAPAYGAVERYVAAIATALGDDCVLIHPGVGELDELGVRTLVVREPTVLRLARALRSCRPRVAHVSDVWPQALVASRLARVPRRLVTHHTPELPRQDNPAGRLWQRLGWATHPEVIYTSEADQRDDGREPSHVVPLGIDADRYTNANPALAADWPIVGTVGRLAPQKGHATFLEAAKLVPEAQFVVVGDGELRGRLDRLAGENVHLTGARDDVPALLASFDVYAQPSSFEGLCVAVLEAQAAGVPVVATPVGGMRETVVDGETGLVVPVGDSQALASAIRRLLDDNELATRLAAEARRRVQANYTERRMVDETLALYE